MAKTYYSLYDRMLLEKNLLRGYQGVKRSNGAAGIDGQTIENFGDNLEENIATLARELREKSYRPSPVRRKEIAKPNGGVRQLGIPTVRDRVVQQTLLNILQPIFDPDFHPSSYGYRPKRGCHGAIKKATLFMRRYNLKWVVDMDLSKCFDTLDHGLILEAVRKKVTDGTILNLIRLFLESGVMEGGTVQATTVGSPQGGVISPLLANIYLDAFDQEMKRRDHRIVRYADDILILKRSRRAAENAMKQASQYLEGPLKLKVNRDKTHIAHSSEGVDYLGVTIYDDDMQIQEKKIEAFRDKVRNITKRNSPVNLEKIIKELNPLLRGFSNYFRITNCGRQYRTLMSWVRRRLRAKQLVLWKSGEKLLRVLRQRGYKGETRRIKMNSWKNSRCHMVHKALPNAFFNEIGLYDMAALDEARISALVT